MNFRIKRKFFVNLACAVASCCALSFSLPSCSSSVFATSVESDAFIESLNKSLNKSLGKKNPLNEGKKYSEENTMFDQSEDENQVFLRPVSKDDFEHLAKLFLELPLNKRQAYSDKYIDKNGNSEEKEKDVYQFLLEDAETKKGDIFEKNNYVICNKKEKIIGYVNILRMVNWPQYLKQAYGLVIGNKTLNSTLKFRLPDVKDSAFLSDLEAISELNGVNGYTFDMFVKPGSRVASQVMTYLIEQLLNYKTKEGFSHCDFIWGMYNKKKAKFVDNLFKRVKNKFKDEDSLKYDIESRTMPVTGSYELNEFDLSKGLRNIPGLNEEDLDNLSVNLYLVKRKEAASKLKPQRNVDFDQFLTKFFKAFQTAYLNDITHEGKNSVFYNIAKGYYAQNKEDGYSITNTFFPEFMRKAFGAVKELPKISNFLISLEREYNKLSKGEGDACEGWCWCPSCEIF